MNGKKAKSLRALAQRMTVGQPAKEYQPKMFPKHIPETRRLVEGCTRYAYQGLKAVYRRLSETERSSRERIDLRESAAAQ